jgi:hypothetical protein
LKKNRKLPTHVTKGVKKAQDDIKEGRTVSYEEFKKTLAISG